MYHGAAFHDTNFTSKFTSFIILIKLFLGFPTINDKVDNLWSVNKVIIFNNSNINAHSLILIMLVFTRLPVYHLNTQKHAAV